MYLYKCMPNHHIYISCRVCSDPAVSHALSVRSALRTENYHRFFSLCRRAPNLGGCLLALSLPWARAQALLRLCKAYKPRLPLRFVADELGFDGDAEAEAFLRRAGCLLVEDIDGDVSSDVNVNVDRQQRRGALALDTKDSAPSLASLFGQDNTLM